MATATVNTANSWRTAKRGFGTLAAVAGAGFLAGAGLLIASAFTANMAMAEGGFLTMLLSAVVGAGASAAALISAGIHHGQRRREVRRGGTALAQREAELLERTRAVEYQEQRLAARAHKLNMHEQWLDSLEQTSRSAATQAPQHAGYRR